MSWLNVTTFVEEKDILPPSYWTFYCFLFLRIDCLVLPQPRTQVRIEYHGLQRGIPADTTCTGGQSSKYTMREFQLPYRTFTAVGQSVPAGRLTDFYPGAKPKLWKGLNMGGKLKKPLLSLLGCAVSGPGTQLLFPLRVSGPWGCLLLLTDLFIFVTHVVWKKCYSQVKTE